MNPARRIFRLLMFAACVAQPVLAQPLTNSPASSAGKTNDATSLPQFIKSPVESFRELLVMPTPERLQFVTVYPPEIRTRILEKVAEYQSLPPKEYESRLQVTELRWYLLPLLSLSASNQAAQLKLIPPAMRELVEPRLQRWSILPPPLRQMLLTNEQAADYLIPGGPISESPALTEHQRRRLSENFRRMIEFTPDEQDKILRRLSDAEHRQMEKTLEAFEKLPPDQRARCIRSFSKLAALSAGEQREFLKNAARWSQMTHAERQAWRELVSIAPILPPLPPPRRPPYPPGFPASVATNGN